jgi:hypothetical protein
MMPMKLEGSCRCGAVRFTCDSHTPYPYQLCYCSICRKTAGGGGYAINLMAAAKSLVVHGGKPMRIYRAEIDGETSSGQRYFCGQCASALWLFDDEWADLVHPFASVIDTDLPKPPSRVHLMLKFKANWVEPAIGPDDACFQDYPEQSIEEWHRSRGLWID